MSNGPWEHRPVIVPRCKACKTTDSLAKNGNRLRKDGSKRQLYLCRPCNAAKKRREGKVNPAMLGRITEAYRKRFPEKHRARLLARKHVPLEPCAVCGDKRAVRHHEDYSKPLEVICLCYLHHKHVHLGLIPCPK